MCVTQDHNPLSTHQPTHSLTRSFTYFIHSVQLQVRHIGEGTWIQNRMREEKNLPVLRRSDIRNILRPFGGVLLNAHSGLEVLYEERECSAVEAVTGVAH